MKYIKIEFEDSIFWIEIDKEGYATRQIVQNHEDIEISCKNDCLAEGIINVEELEGKKVILSEQEFNDKWDEIITPFIANWKDIKKQYPVGKSILGIAMFNYPSGWVIKINNDLGLYYGSKELKFGQELFGEITGYDEKNMWVLIS